MSHERAVRALLRTEWDVDVKVGDAHERQMLAEVLLATRNRGKLREFREALAPLGIRITTPAERGLAFRVDETGTTFVENARLKAEALSQAAGMPALADDSGLVVEALDGELGVRSQRFAGPDATDADRNRLILRRLEGVPPELRAARFEAAIALAIPGADTLVATGTALGRIAEQPRGSNGFGYDPIFYVPSAGKTFGEMTIGEKRRVSHRRKALDALMSLVARRGLAAILEKSRTTDSAI